MHKPLHFDLKLIILFSCWFHPLINTVFILRQKPSEFILEEEAKIFGGGQQDETKFLDFSKVKEESKAESFFSQKFVEDKLLEIVEINVLNHKVLKRFAMPNLKDQTEIDSKYNDEIVESGHNFHLYFEYDSDSGDGYLFVSMPNACLGIYDYTSSHLLYTFKAESKFLTQSIILDSK